MSEEISFDSLGLSKPLDKMTAKELRELCINKIPQITGASGMDKDALVKTIKELFGITEEAGAPNPYKDQIRTIKKDIVSLREDKAKAATRKEKDILRKKINTLKKRTRRLASAV